MRGTRNGACWSRLTAEIWHKVRPVVLSEAQHPGMRQRRHVGGWSPGGVGPGGAGDKLGV